MFQLTKTAQRCGVASVVLVTILLFVCPGSVAAIPLAEYHQKLKQSITEFGKLIRVDEDESSDEFKAQLDKTIDDARIALPQHLTVEADADVYNVDNSVLYRSLDELKAAHAETRIDEIRKVTDILQALEARVAQRELAPALLDSKQQARNKLDSILARPEYATGDRGTNALNRLIRDFFRWLEKFFPKRRNVDPSRVDLISMIARILVIGVAVGVLTYVGVVFLRRFSRTRATRAPKKKAARIVLGERLEPEATATDLLSQAETLARQGDLRAAIRKAYIALLVELGDRKLISLAQHKTNRDYLNSVRSMPPLHSTMRGLTESFERHWYGSEQATPGDWQDFRAGYLAALQVEH